MRPGDDPQDAAKELRVTDRRRFTADGDIRDGEAEAPEPAAPAAPAPSPAPSPAPPTATSASTDPPTASARPRDGQAPPGQEAVFDFGIEAVFYVFYQSALIALGATQPGGPPARVDLAEARQAITFMKVLEQKTRGNLTPEEAATLRELLDEAQMAFVQVARSMPGGPA